MLRQNAERISGPVFTGVGVAGVHEVLDDVDDLADMLGSAGAHGGRT